MIAIVSKDKNDLVSILAREEKSKPRLYPEVAKEIKAEVLTRDIGGKLAALDEYGKVDLDDTDEVVSRTRAYLEACSEAGTFPSVLGLSSMALGISRQWLNEFCRTHPKHPTAEFVERVKDLFADVMVNSALNKTASDSVAIFILKNCNGFSDRLEITPAAPPNPLGDLMSPEELEARINDLIECCDTEDTE